MPSHSSTTQGLRRFLHLLQVASRRSEGSSKPRVAFNPQFLGRKNYRVLPLPQVQGVGGGGLNKLSPSVRDTCWRIRPPPECGKVNFYFRICRPPFPRMVFKEKIIVSSNRAVGGGETLIACNFCLQSNLAASVLIANFFGWLVLELRSATPPTPPLEPPTISSQFATTTTSFSI